MRTCYWCGDEIHDEKVVFVVEAEDKGHKIDPSFPEAVFHTGTCFIEARDYGWSE